MKRFLIGVLLILALLIFWSKRAFSDLQAENVTASDHVQIILQAPYGIKNSGVKNSTGLIMKNSTVNSLVIVESYTPEPLEVNFRIEIPKPLSPVNIPDGIEVIEESDRFFLDAKFQLVTEFDDWYRLFSIQIPDRMESGQYNIEAQARFRGVIDGQRADFVITQNAGVRIVDQRELQNLLTVASIKIPADADGKADDKFSENTLLLKSELGLIGKIFGGVQQDDVAPVSFVGLRMKNKAREDAVVQVNWDVLDPVTENEVRGFRISKDFISIHGGGDDRIYTRVIVPGREEINFSLPIFADEEMVLAGRYLGRIDIRLLGSDAMVKQEYFDLNVQKMTWSSIGLTLYAIVASLGIGLIILTRQADIFRRFKTRWLILIALFGTTKFLMSLLPRFFLTDLFNGLLGPFAVFANGLVREGITNLLIMALVVLIPHPGVVTLSMSMSLVMLCLTGNFNPVIILFLMVTISTTEVALYITGFTRAHSQGFTRTKKAFILAALGMGIAGAFTIYVDYNLYMVLYRLYYAQWFIWSNIIIVGFVYNSIFVQFGLILGNKLRRVAIE